MTILFADAAREELLGAATHYEGVSRTTRRRFLRTVVDALRLVQLSPDLFAAYEGGRNASRFRRVLVDGFPYVVVYRAEKDVVRVVAVAHASRAPGYWERR